MKNPTVSVICRTYNQERFINQAIQSVLNQTLSDWELIVINDASTDGTESVILSFKDPRIKYIRNDKNLGPIENLNIGIQNATGKYITILDGDDIFYPNKLWIQTEFLDQNPDYGAVFAYINPIDVNGNQSHSPTATTICNLINNPAGTRAEMLRKAFDVYNFLAFPTEMFRRQFAIYFNAHLLSCGDGYFHINTLLQTKIKVLEIPLTKYRIIDHKTNVSGWISNMTDMSEKFFMLDKFLEIKDTKLFHDMFSDVIGEQSVTPLNIPVILTQIAENTSDPIKKLWANYTFHRLMADPNAYNMFMKNKSYSDFIKSKLGKNANLRICGNNQYITQKHKIKKYKFLFNVLLGLNILLIFAYVAMLLV